MIGQQIAHYKVTAKLGQGGMGEVYRATDTKLGREVALKVLPQEFAADPQRMARFEREAQVLASLNHPNIATIHGFEEAGTARALVMELVEGPTLAERIAVSSVPLDEALPIAKQVTEALEYAHEKGIIHRDLKPANIKIGNDGKVKVLDFGLAKALSDDVAAQDISTSPTLSMAATKAGIILGTAAYMSPEQAKGKSLDRRADIWAFGVVLYEMLSGQKMFAGETAADVLAHVITKEPNWDALPAATSRRLRQLLRRCLQKDSRNRLRDIGDARLELEAEIAGPESSGIPVAESKQLSWHKMLRHPASWILAGLMAVGGVFAGWRWGYSPDSSSAPVLRFTIPLPKESLKGTFANQVVAFSPDGSRFVYCQSSPGGMRLSLRALDQSESAEIPGTAGVNSPFFSPDGQWLGFFDQGTLKKVALGGGAPVALAEAKAASGGSWGDKNQIVYSPDFSRGLFITDATGGKPQPLTSRSIEKGESGHAWPQILPGSRAAIFTVELSGKPFDDARIELVTIPDGKRKVLIEGGTAPHYISTGHIVFARLDSLFAVPFDLEKLEVTGPPVSLRESVAIHPGTGASNYSVSRQGSLISLHGDLGLKSRMVSVDRKGNARPVLDEPRMYDGPRFSPDGKRIVLFIRSSDDDVWVYDLERKALSRITSTAENQWPLWTPDGRNLTFTSSRNGSFNLFTVPADGSSQPVQFVRSDEDLEPYSWSPDGEWLAYAHNSRDMAGGDIWMFSAKDGQSKPFLQTPFAEKQATFSPDGKWLAYTSNQSGRDEVYVQPFPGPGGRVQVSVDGGETPRWARNEKEMFFVQGDKLMVAPVQLGATFTAGKVQVLLNGVEKLETFPPVYDVSPDGREFLLLRRANPNPEPLAFHVVVNWFTELKRKLASGK